MCNVRERRGLDGARTGLAPAKRTGGGRCVPEGGRANKGYLDLYGQQGEGRIKQLEFSLAKSEQLIAELEAKRRQIDEKIEEVRLINQICRRKIAAKKRSKNGTRAG